MKSNLLINTLPGAKSEGKLAVIGNAGIKTGLFLAKWKLALSIGVNLLLFGLIAACPAFAQPNPFGGSGTSKLANAGSNLLVVLTWASFLTGLIAFASIALCIWFEKDYKKNIAVGLSGTGGFLIMGSIAYDIVNLSTLTMSDPKIGQ